MSSFLGLHAIFSSHRIPGLEVSRTGHVISHFAELPLHSPAPLSVVLVRCLERMLALPPAIYTSNGTANSLSTFSSLQYTLNCINQKQRYQNHQIRTRACAPYREENQGTLGAIIEFGGESLLAVFVCCEICGAIGCVSCESRWTSSVY